MKLLCTFVLFTLAASGLHAGTWQWARSGSNGPTQPTTAIATDANGNVFATGNFTGSTTFDGTVLNVLVAYGVFIVKYDHSGNLQWARHGDNTGVFAISGTGICTDAVGNCFVTGSFKGTIKFGTDSVVANNGNSASDIFLAKYSSDGTLQWLRRAGGPGDDFANAICADGSGDVFLTGSVYQSGVQFDTVSVGGLFTRTYVAKYNAAGHALWVQHGGPSDNSGGGYAQGNSIAYDPTGNIIACGIFDTQSAVFGADQLTTGGFADIFVLKVSASNGAYVWTKQAGSGNADVAASVCADNTGKVFLTGAYGNAGTLGTFPISAGSGFVAQLNSAGIAQWAHEVHNGSVPINGGSGLATDAAGTLYMAGGYAGTAHFGADSLVSPVTSSPAVFVVAYSNAGAYQWGLTDAGMFSNCAGTCVSVSPTGFVDVGGICSPNSTFGTTSFSGYGSLIAQINSGVSGIEEIASDRSLIVYPNPATDMIWMMNDKPLRDVMIIDARGQGTAVRMNDDHTLDIRSLAPGVYCLRATMEGKGIFARFTKQ